MRRLFAYAAVFLLTAAAACADGNGSTATDAARTIELDMVDLAFKPDALKVVRGETIRFVFTNRGEAPHDAFIGDAKAQADHEAEMREAESGHGGHGDDEAAVTVDKGDTGEIVHTFDEAGTVEIGCHQPGHYAAGMKVTVEVA